MSIYRLALVTGASRGIGRAIAENLGASGHTIVGTATSQAGADNISAYFAEQKIGKRNDGHNHSGLVPPREQGHMDSPSEDGARDGFLHQQRQSSQEHGSFPAPR